MELRQLEHFVAVAETRHFTRAADEKLITQSGLSASIRSLERELGTVLFARNTRSVELTAAGRALLTEARRTLAAAAAAHAAVAAVQGVLRGRVSVGLEQCLGVVDVPTLLARFRSAHPGVQIAVRQAGSAQLLDQLAAHRLDVAFVGTGDQPVDSVELRPLTAEPMVLISPPEHWVADAGPVPLHKLAGEVFIDFSPDWGARGVADRARAAAGVLSPSTVEVNDVHTLLALVGHGLGVALVPARIAAKPGRHATVALIDGAAEQWRVSVAVPRGPAVNPAAQALIELIPGPTAPNSRRRADSALPEPTKECDSDERS